MPTPRIPTPLAAIAALILAAPCVLSPGAALAQPDPSTTEAYWFGILSRGPSWTPVKSARNDSIQAGHLANIERMWKHGALLVAGPFEKGDQRRGVFIFRHDSLALIRRLAAADPAIASGRLVLDLVEWWAPKGIGAAYRARAEAEPGRQDSMIVAQIVFLKAPAKPVAPPKDYDALHQRHVDGVMRLNESGKAVAGPFGGDGVNRGIAVVQGSAEEARALLAGDLLVRAGLLELEVMGWWVAEGAMTPAPAKAAATKSPKTGTPGQRAVLGTVAPPEPPVRTPPAEPAAKLPPPTVVVAPPGSGPHRPAFGEYVYVEELPEAITKANPVYPEEARRAGVSGTVMVQVLVLKDGTVGETRVVKSIAGLDEAAVAAVRQWRFQPAKSKGEPVAVWVAVPVSFSLR